MYLYILTQTFASHMFKFLLFFILIFLAIRGVFIFLFRILSIGRYNSQGKKNPQQPPNRPKQPETQDERIIDYQKKTFESTEVEDADFVEIKDCE